ncbi:MAG: hypothetical protein V1846_02810 [Candidatus Komeilibacteria bacterium]
MASHYSLIIAKIRKFCWDNRFFLILVVFLVVMTAATYSHYLYNWDAGQFALGAKRFSLSEHQPHPPGYWLFTETIKSFNLFLSDGNLSMILINLVASMAAIFFFYRTTMMLTGKRLLAFWLTLLLLTNQVFWFYRSVASTYLIEILTVCFLLYTSIRMQKGSRSLLPYSCLAVALLAGFRPSVILIAAPLLLYQLILSPHKVSAIIKSLTGVLLGLALWLPALAAAAGGYQALYHFIIGQFIIAETSTRAIIISHDIFLVATILYTTFVPLIIGLLFYKKIYNSIRSFHLWFIVATLVWQISIYLILHFDEVGYILGLIPLSYILILPALEHLASKRNQLVISCLVISGLQLILFFTGIPLTIQPKVQALNYQDISRHDQRIQSQLAFISKYDPATTLVIITRGQYLTADNVIASYPYNDIRLMSYYLPQYKIYDLLGVKNKFYVASNYTYSEINNETVTTMAPAIKQIIIVADYIHPTYLPLNLQWRSLYPSFNIKNVYFADLGDQTNFIYSGQIFSKNP